MQRAIARDQWEAAKRRLAQIEPFTEPGGWFRLTDRGFRVYAGIVERIHFWGRIVAVQG